MHIPLVHPSSILIAGPSGSGKTVFVRNLLLNHMLSPAPSRIVIVYGEWQKEYALLQHHFPNIEFHKGPMPPDLYESFSPNENNLLVLDDQMTDAANSGQLEKYFVQGAHHRNLTIIFIVQNLFEKGKAMRSTNLNSNYLVLYKNPRDKGQMAVLGRQMYPSKWKGFVSALQDATEEPYSYLVVDLRPETPEEFRLRGNIFPGRGNENPPTDIYIIQESTNS